MTLGTAKVQNHNGLWIVTYTNIGSFLKGEQMFGNINAALRFCRQRDLRVTACVC